MLEVASRAYCAGLLVISCEWIVGVCTRTHKEDVRDGKGPSQAVKSWQLALVVQTGQTSRCIRAQNGGAIVHWTVQSGSSYVTDPSRDLPQTDSARVRSVVAADALRCTLNFCKTSIRGSHLCWIAMDARKGTDPRNGAWTVLVCDVRLKAGAPCGTWPCRRKLRALSGFITEITKTEPCDHELSTAQGRRRQR